MKVCVCVNILKHCTFLPFILSRGYSLKAGLWHITIFMASASKLLDKIHCWSWAPFMAILCGRDVYHSATHQPISSASFSSYSSFDFASSGVKGIYSYILQLKVVNMSLWPLVDLVGHVLSCSLCFNSCSSLDFGGSCEVSSSLWLDSRLVPGF